MKNVKNKDFNLESFKEGDLTSAINDLILLLQLKQTKTWITPTQNNDAHRIYMKIYEELYMRKFFQVQGAQNFYLQGSYADFPEPTLNVQGKDKNPDYMYRDKDGIKRFIEVKYRERTLTQVQYEEESKEIIKKYGKDIIVIFLNGSMSGILREFNSRNYTQEFALLKMCRQQLELVEQFKTSDFKHSQQTDSEIKRWFSLLDDIAPMLKEQAYTNADLDLEELKKLEDSLETDILSNLEIWEPWVNNNVLFTENILDYYQPRKDGNIDPNDPYNRESNLKFSIENQRNTHEYGHQAKFMAFHVGFLNNFEITDQDLLDLQSYNILPFQIESDRRKINEKCSTLVDRMKMSIKIQAFLSTEAGRDEVKNVNQKYFKDNSSRSQMIESLTEFKVECEEQITNIFINDIRNKEVLDPETSIQFNKHGGMIIKNKNLFAKAFLHKNPRYQKPVRIEGALTSQAKIDPSNCLVDLDENIASLNCAKVELPLGNFLDAYKDCGFEGLNNLSNGLVLTAKHNIQQITEENGWKITYAIHTLNKTIKGNVGKSNRKFESSDSIVSFLCPHTKVYTHSSPATNNVTGPSMVHFGKIKKEDINVFKLKWIGPIQYVEIGDFIFWYNPRPVSINWEVANASDRFIFGSLLIATSSIEFESNLHKKGLFWSLFWNFARSMKGVLDLIYLVYKNAIYQGSMGRMKIEEEFEVIQSNDLRISQMMFNLKESFNEFGKKCFESTTNRRRQLVVGPDPVFKADVTGWGIYLFLVFIKQIYPKPDGADNVAFLAKFVDKEIVLRKNYIESPMHHSKLKFNHLFNWEKFCKMMIVDEKTISPLGMYDPAVSKIMRIYCKDARNNYSMSQIRQDILIPVLSTNKNSSVLMPEVFYKNEEVFKNYDIEAGTEDLLNINEKEAKMRENFYNNKIKKEITMEDIMKYGFKGENLEEFNSNNNRKKEINKDKRMKKLMENLNNKKADLISGIRSEKLDIAQIRLLTMLRCWYLKREHSNLTKGVKKTFDDLIDRSLIKTILFKDDSQLNLGEMCLLCCLLSACQVILQMVIKQEQKLGKRVFFTQTLFNKIPNQVYDLLLIPLLTTPANDVDVVNLPGLQKMIAMKEKAKTINLKPNNLTSACDITRYGDSMLLRLHFRMIKTCQEEGYLTENEYIFMNFVTTNLLKRKIIIPLDLQKKIAIKIEGEKNEIDINLPDKYYQKYSSAEMRSLMLDSPEGDEGLTDSLFKDLIHTLKIVRENGGTLGVFNKFWSVASSAYVKVLQSVLRLIFTEETVVGSTLSDDNLNMTIFELMKQEVFTNLCIKDVLFYYRKGNKIRISHQKIKGKPIETFYHEVSKVLDVDGIEKEISTLITDPLFGSKCSKLYLVLMNIVPRLVSNQPSGLKFTFGADSEVTQLMISNTGNFFAPLIRWLTTLSDNLAGECPYYDTMDSMSKCYDIDVNGGTALQIATCQIIANTVVTVRFGLGNERTTDHLPQNFGLFYVYPDLLREDGFNGNLIRLLANGNFNKKIKRELQLSLDTYSVYKDYSLEKPKSNIEAKFKSTENFRKEQIEKIELERKIADFEKSNNIYQTKTSIKPETLIIDKFLNLRRTVSFKKQTSESEKAIEDLLLDDSMLEFINDEEENSFENIEVEINSEDDESESDSENSNLIFLPTSDNFSDDEISRLEEYMKEEEDKKRDEIVSKILSKHKNSYRKIDKKIKNLKLKNNLNCFILPTELDIINDIEEDNEFVLIISETEVPNLSNLYGQYNTTFLENSLIKNIDVNVEKSFKSLAQNLLSKKLNLDISDFQHEFNFRIDSNLKSFLGVFLKPNIILKTYDSNFEIGIRNLWVKTSDYNESDELLIRILTLELKDIFGSTLTEKEEENFEELELLEESSLSFDQNLDNKISENLSIFAQKSSFNLVLENLIKDSKQFFSENRESENSNFKVEREEKDTTSATSTNNLTSFIVFPIRYNRQAKAVAAYKEFRHMVKEDFLKFAKEHKIFKEGDDIEMIETSVLSALSLLLITKTSSTFLEIAAEIRKMRSSKYKENFVRIDPDFASIRRWGYMKMWISNPFNEKFRNITDTSDVLTIEEFVNTIYSLSENFEIQIPRLNEKMVSIMYTVHKEAIDKLINPLYHFDTEIIERMNPITIHQENLLSHSELKYRRSISKENNDSFEDQKTEYIKIKSTSKTANYSETDLQLAIAQVICLKREENVNPLKTLVMQMVPKLITDEKFPDLVEMMKEFIRQLGLEDVSLIEKLARQIVSLLTPDKFHGIVKQKENFKQRFEKSQNSYSFRHKVSIEFNGSGEVSNSQSDITEFGAFLKSAMNTFLFLLWALNVGFLDNEDIRTRIKIFYLGSNKTQDFLSVQYIGILGSRINKLPASSSIFFSLILLHHRIHDSNLKLVEKNDSFNQDLKLFLFSFMEWPILFLTFNKLTHLFTIEMEGATDLPNSFVSQWDYAKKMSIFITKIHGNNKNYFNDERSLGPGSMKFDENYNEMRIFGDLVCWETGPQVETLRSQPMSRKNIVKSFFIIGKDKIRETIKIKGLNISSIGTVGMIYQEKNVGFGENTIITPWEYNSNEPGTTVTLYNQILFKDEKIRVKTVNFPNIVIHNRISFTFKSVSDFEILFKILDILSIDLFEYGDDEIPFSMRNSIYSRRIENWIGITYLDFLEFFYYLEQENNFEKVFNIYLKIIARIGSNFTSSEKLEYLLKKIKNNIDENLRIIKNQFSLLSVNFIVSKDLLRSLTIMEFEKILRIVMLAINETNSTKITKFINISYKSNKKSKENSKSLINKMGKEILKIINSIENELIFFFEKEEDDGFIEFFIFFLEEEIPIKRNQIVEFIEDILTQNFEVSEGIPASNKEQDFLLKPHIKFILKLTLFHIEESKGIFGLTSIIQEIQKILKDDFSKENLELLNKISKSRLFPKSIENKMQPIILSFLFGSFLVNESNKELLKWTASTFLSDEIPEKRKTFIYDGLILGFLLETEPIFLERFKFLKKYMFII